MDSNIDTENTAPGRRERGNYKEVYRKFPMKFKTVHGAHKGWYRRNREYKVLTVCLYRPFVDDCSIAES